MTVADVLRPYDLVVRVEGDEFACALVDLDESEARDHFGTVISDLADVGASVTIGITAPEPTDILKSVITRADDAMCAERR